MGTGKTTKFDDTPHVGKALQELRKAKGVSRLQLSHAANVSDVAIAAIEKGEVQPRIDTLEKICDALGADLSELFAAR